MNELVLTKKSPESDLKRYFTAVLELSKCDNKFPINLDEVWMLVYERKDKAFRSLRKHFYEGEDFYLTQMGKVVTFNKLQNGVKTECFLSVSCMEYFIARKVRPVFEVYRQVFHNTAKTPSLPTTYKEALTQLLAEVEHSERLQLENRKLQEDVQTQQNIISMQMGEIETLAPKGRIYDEVIATPNDDSLYTTRQVAQEIGMSDRQLLALLVQLNVIYRQSNTYMMNSDYVDWGMHKMVSYQINEGNVKTYIKWTIRGRAYIHALYDTKWDKRRAWHLLKRGHELQRA